MRLLESREIEMVEVTSLVFIQGNDLEVMRSGTLPPAASSLRAGALGGMNVIFPKPKSILPAAHTCIRGQRVEGRGTQRL
jgi:hypothetical protein